MLPRCFLFVRTGSNFLEGTDDGLDLGRKILQGQCRFVERFALHFGRWMEYAIAVARNGGENRRCGGGHDECGSSFVKVLFCFCLQSLWNAISFHAIGATSKL